MMRPTWKICGPIILLMFFSAGCGALKGSRKPRAYKFQQAEAEWIRNGDPVEFEGVKWYPQDDIEILTDTEVDKVGEFRGVEIFIEKIDVRPYNRLYTKFSQNKFRMFEQKNRP